MAAKLASGMDPATANRIRATLRRALGQALDWGLVRENVVKRTKAARERPFHAQPLTADQAREFLAATSEDRLFPLWALALGTGVRQGEALALTWPDVDLEAGTATIEKTLQRPRDGSGGWRLEPPKSSRARRTVSLPAFVVTALRAHRPSQGREKLARGGDWAEGDFVFTTTRGTPLDGPNVTHQLQRALADAGLPRQRFHDLRHAAASLLLAQGADLRTVMEVLGHSSITLTANTYAHVGRAALKDAAAKLDAALGGA
jgi:integrase